MSTDADDLATQYGLAAQVIASDPELRRLLHEALGEWDDYFGEWKTPPMTADEFREAIKHTDAYKARFPSMPNWVPLPEPRRSRWHRLRTALAQRIAPWLDEDI